MMQDATLAATAAGIGAVEAGHAAVVRYQLYEVGHELLGAALTRCQLESDHVLGNAAVGKQ